MDRIQRKIEHCHKMMNRSWLPYKIQDKWWRKKWKWMWMELTMRKKNAEKKENFRMNNARRRMIVKMLFGETKLGR